MQKVQCTDGPGGYRAISAAPSGVPPSFQQFGYHGTDYGGVTVIGVSPVAI